MPFANAESAAKYLRKWHAKNPGKSAAYSAKWRTANPAKEKARRDTYRTNNKQKRNAYAAEYRKRDHVKLKHRLRAYGLTADEFAAMQKEQNNRCIGCEVSFDESKPYVDHCHRSGTVRGLLCKLCNLALGSAIDSPETLRRLALYLEKYK